MAELRTVRRRKNVPKSQFAYVDSRGEGHLPIEDESHVRTAMARFNQTEFESERAKASARRKILAAAKRYGIEVSPNDEIAKGTTSLRPADTKRGPRGGRKVVRPKRRTTARQRTAARKNIKTAARLRRARARR